jgi:hypothetical protein
LSEVIRKVSSPLVLVDAHVHFHAGFERGSFLDAATTSFAAASARLGRTPATTTGVLIFTECAGAHFFQEFRESAGEAWPGGWVARRTAEPASLAARREDGSQLLLLAGRQIVTRERLELLALACDAEFPDGVPVESSIEEVERAGGLAVLPWGFGKWTFDRGRRVADLLRHRGADGLLLGDSGGRPALWPRPALIREAEHRGVGILSGSDPLPLPGEIRRVGSFGSVLRVALDRDRPALSLLRTARDAAFRPETYGRLLTLKAFLRNQINLRLWKRPA